MRIKEIPIGCRYKGVMVQRMTLSDIR
jgi:hypothetical protein